MRAQVRWTPVSDLGTLRDEMIRVFGDVCGGNTDATRTGATPVDVFENEREYLVRAALPGFEPANVNVTYQDGALTIRAERTEDKVEGFTPLHRETSPDPIERTINLEKLADFEKSTAKLEKGILTITLPKHESTRPREIRVTG
ncbi:MAG: Hsp20/alpha crystallin family protein [Planctomycetes bacterium]|nr:Hsp20/alpha crystallin family protein [Planctomycetota bacterium]MBI3846379.1 Hsp20/alpha crystallin family protein [Planctomycetota bacterium]